MSTVIGEFAINPACITSLDDLKLASSRFGFRNGAVISQFPGRWVAEVLSNAQSLEEPTRTAFKERVRKLRETALVRLGRGFPSEKLDWLECALHSNSKDREFYSILHTSSANYCRSYSDAIDDDALFDQLRSGKILRNAQSLIHSIYPLICGSERFCLIDPFFAPNAYYAKFVHELICQATSVSQRKLYIDIHLEHRTPRSPSLSINGEISDVEMFKEWVCLLPGLVHVTVTWWKDNGTEEIHPRYLVTERGGVVFDRGFKIPAELIKQEVETDVSMMTDSFAKEVEKRYSGTYRPLQIVHSEEYRK